MRADDITQAVLARNDVAKYLRSGGASPEDDAQERVEAYLDELRTTQRYRFYRALQHPLYPILRKVRRVAEHVELAREATTRGRVLYVSNHKSHLDYLVEPLVLDDNGIRPPVVAAGINLFGGPLGLLHRHVTGAIPIRRNSKDPLYLVTLRAYIAELLNRRDLLYYAEGGRSYSGELQGAEDRPAPGGAAGRPRPRCRSCRWRSPTTSSLEERIISREAIAPASRPFYAGSRGDGPARGRLPVARVRDVRPRRFRWPTTIRESRRDLVTLTHRVHDADRAAATRCCPRRSSPPRCGPAADRTRTS